MRSPLVVIVLLNWNGWLDTVACLKSLQRLVYDDFRVVVVDNGSIDDSVQRLSVWQPFITLLEAGENLGFAVGNNLGICWALEQGAEYVLLLNNDTVVAEDLLEAFVAAAQERPKAGALAAKICYYDRPRTLWYAGSKSPTPWMAPMHIGQEEEDQGQYEEMAPVTGINGCAFFARTEAIREVGLLNERFFYKYEDVDWSLRFSKAGYETLYVPGAKVWHKVSQASGGLSPLWWYFDERSRLLWLELHFPKQGWEAFWGRALRGLWRQLCQTGWRGWPIALARLAGMADYLRGYEGPCPQWVVRLGRRSCERA